MPKKKEIKIHSPGNESKPEFVNSTNGVIYTPMLDPNPIALLELNLGREDLNLVVEKLNEVIKKVNK